MARNGKDTLCSSLRMWIHIDLSMTNTIWKKQLRRLAFDHHDPPEAHVVGQRVVHDSTLGLSYVATVRTPSSKQKTHKRQGAREIKKIEIQTDENDRLSPESATAYRARTARASS